MDRELLCNKAIYCTIFSDWCYWTQRNTLTLTQPQCHHHMYSFEPLSLIARISEHIKCSSCSTYTKSQANIILNCRTAGYTMAIWPFLLLLLFCLFIHSLMYSIFHHIKKNHSNNISIIVCLPKHKLSSQSLLVSVSSIRCDFPFVLWFWNTYHPCLVDKIPTRFNFIYV